ncbi:MAG: TIGR00730 family Rossman fold protein [Gemmatimonadales bacterium]|nr:MAG: TIGR00730 family Rossman fold protein [Gemmatimonadales bacterium]
MTPDRPDPDPTPDTPSDSDSDLRWICVFCGSSAGEDPRYLDAATKLGRSLAARGMGLVYGGSQLGLMGRLADSVLNAGGKVVGVLPEPLLPREVAHRSLTKLVITESMYERKAEMARLADGFIAAPGGLGTIEEFLEVLTWAQLGMHRKPCGILNTNGFYDPLSAVFDHGMREGFIQHVHRKMILIESEPDPLLDRMSAYQPPKVPRWIEVGET